MGTHPCIRHRDGGLLARNEYREWPDWYPTKEILQRKPEIRSALVDLHGGLGMPCGPENPLCARALLQIHVQRAPAFLMEANAPPPHQAAFATEDAPFIACK